MQPGNVLPLIAVVAAFHNVNQAAGRTIAGIILGGKDPAKHIDAHAKRIPESLRHASQPRSVGATPEHAAASPAVRELRSVRARKAIGLSPILAQAEIQFAAEVKGEAGQTIVRIKRRRFHMHQMLHGISAQIAVEIAQPVNVISRGEIKRAIEMKRQVHCVSEALLKHRAFVGAPVRVGVLEHKNAIRGRADVGRGPLVGCDSR